MKVKVKSLSRVRPFATPWTVAHQAPLSMGFSRQEYWSGLPFPLTMGPPTFHVTQAVHRERDVFWHPQTRKLGVCSNISSSNGISIYMNKCRKTLNASVIYIKRWPKCLGHSCFTAFSLPTSIYGFMVSCLRSAGRGREDIGLVCRWLCTIWRHSPKVDSYNTVDLF